MTAFATTRHDGALGYRFDTRDRTIVISGDTRPSQAAIDACNGCDVLVHEVSRDEFLAQPAEFRAYAARDHTSTTELAELATRARPKLLVLYHASIAIRPAVDSQRSAAPKDCSPR